MYFSQSPKAPGDIRAAVAQVIQATAPETAEAAEVSDLSKDVVSPDWLGANIFSGLSDAAYVRQAQLVRSTKHPDSTAPLPFSAPTLWRKVRDGTFPKPIKLGARITAWKVGDVRQWLAAQGVQ